MYEKAANALLNVIVMASINYILRLNMSLVHLIEEAEFRFQLNSGSMG